VPLPERTLPHFQRQEEQKSEKKTNEDRFRYNSRQNIQKKFQRVINVLNDNAESLLEREENRHVQRDEDFTEYVKQLCMTKVKTGGGLVRG
jgi:hypothetical protein